MDQENPIGSLDELWQRIFEASMRMDVLLLLRLLQRRRDRLARMQELDMPQVVIDYEQTMIAATEHAARERGII